MYTKRMCNKLEKLLYITMIIILFNILAKYLQELQRTDFSQKEQTKLKYILIWTIPTRDPIKYLGEGQNTFITRRCSDINCYVSNDRQLFGDITQFDVIVFHSVDMSTSDLPKSRSTHQKYVFASMESADYYPIRDTVFNNYFNWTWTYKLNSDIVYGYISIKNDKSVVIGPKENMNWKNIEDMNTTDETLREKVSGRTKAAAWFVSNCNTHSQREYVVQNLLIEMVKRGLTLDIYGNCGVKTCSRNSMSDCLRLLQRDYYFYLSFENSFTPDYVTEKLLHALQHYTIPIVFGGANYTRFMPKGIYLDARTMTTTQLVKEMEELINNKEKYYSYYKWHNHYSYHGLEESPITDPYCNLCSMINKNFEQTSIYSNFSHWWNAS